MNNLYVKTSSFSENINGLSDYFDENQLRKVDDFYKIVACAAARALNDIGFDTSKENDEIGLIISTGRGPVKEACTFMDAIIDNSSSVSIPSIFIASFHNCLAVTVARLLNLRGPSLTVSQGSSSFSSALLTAKSWLLSKRCKYVLLGVADEIHPALQKEFEHKIYNKEGAAFFLITLEETKEKLNLEEIRPDDFNPSFPAFKLALKLAPIVNKSDIEKMITDYIKIYLASRKANIMEVFDKKTPLEFLRELKKEEREDIFNGLKTLCSIDAQDNFDNGNLTDICFNSLLSKNRVNFFTSGSTGLPKNCIHTKEMIKEETDGLTFLVQKSKRIVSTVSAHHSYGFIFTVQLPKYLGLPLLSRPPFPFLQWNKTLREGDLLVTFPLFLKYLMQMGFKFPKGVTVVTSTSQCPDELMEKVYQSGAERLIEIYGSSETGAVGFRESPGSPFFLLPFWDYAEQGGTIKEIYRKNTSFREELPDVVKLKGERVFTVIERKDNAVQVAGVNVYPAKVERLLRQHEAIKDVVVRLGRERLKAFIVLHDGIEVKEAQKSIQSYMNSLFTSYEIPKKITFGRQVPITPYGKKADWD